MSALIVIPARYGSTRFPGKPLAIIAGRTLLERVVDLARRAIRDKHHATIIVATDDDRIMAHAAAIRCAAVMTDPSLRSGSARALAAAREHAQQPQVLINLQGDAPFIPVAAIGAVLTALAKGATVATAVVELDWPALDELREHKRQSPFSGTTCVRSANGDALWFSKAILPAIRDEASLRSSMSRSPIFRHLGLYGYTRGALEAFEAAPPSRYEQLEGLEQLRFLELGMSIRTVLVEDQPSGMSGIDTLEDALRAEELINRYGDPFGT